MLSGRCHYHPDRLGLGICVECRHVICQECTTQFEGINRCAQCLAARHAQLQRRTVRRAWSVGNVLLSLTAFATVYGVVWLLTQLVEG